MKVFPWMPTYIDEILRLAAILTPEQLGGLVRLKAHAWQQDPPCTLPDNDSRLATISGLHGRWGEEGDAIRELLEPTENGRLLDPALKRLYDEQLQKHVSAQLRGRKGGRPKKQQPNQPTKQPEKLSESPTLQQLRSLSILDSQLQVRTENPERAKLHESSASYDWREDFRAAEKAHQRAAAAPPTNQEQSHDDVVPDDPAYAAPPGVDPAAP